jgi:uncharacterized RDD family membrane protein YckC
MELAGRGPRLVGFIVDWLICFLPVIFGMYGCAFSASPLSGSPEPAAAVAYGGLAVLALGYFPFFWARSGATLGMRMMGIRVVSDRDAGPLSVGQAIVRLIGDLVSIFTYGLLFVWIIVDKRGRGLHDRLAGTVVVKRRGDDWVHA